jgi:hypothetical protein
VSADDVPTWTVYVPEGVIQTPSAHVPLGAGWKYESGWFEADSSMVTVTRRLWPARRFTF